MKKLMWVILFLLIPSMGYTQPMTDLNFTYSVSYRCSPEENSPEWETYNIHLDKSEKHVVIKNRESLHKSYEKTVTPHLWVLVGSTNTLSFSRNDDVFIFRMKGDPSDHKHYEYGGSYLLEKKGDYYLETLIFDKSDLSYTIRTVWKNNQDKIYKTFPSTIGFCELKHTQ